MNFLRKRTEWTFWEKNEQTFSKENIDIYFFIKKDWIYFFKRKDSIKSPRKILKQSLWGKKNVKVSAAMSRETIDRPVETPGKIDVDKTSTFRPKTQGFLTTYYLRKRKTCVTRFAIHEISTRHKSKRKKKRCVCEFPTFFSAFRRKTRNIGDVWWEQNEQEQNKVIPETVGWSESYTKGTSVPDNFKSYPWNKNKK